VARKPLACGNLVCMTSPNLHIVSLPHTASRYEYSFCAYTQKSLKLARMMEKYGYGVTLYAAEGPSDFHNTVGCVPDPGPAHVVEPEWTTEYFREMNARAIAAIQERAQPRDLILLTTGWPQKPIADFFGAEHQVVEYGIGYEGVFAPFRVFESYAWMQTVYGREAGMTGESAMSKQGRFYDAVIPNYFEVDQFPAGTGDGGYLLFLGRLIESKGLRVAIDAAKRAGLPLVVAGQGNPEEFGLAPGRTEKGAPLYVGVADPQYRAALMGGAIAILCPSLYLEPFGGAAVEAQMCGTPAITTDWGAYCVPTDAEVLTERGWLRFDQIRSDDKTLGYDPKTSSLQWTSITGVQVFDEQKTVEYSNRNWAVRVTAAHRWSGFKRHHNGTETELIKPFSEMADTDRVRLAAPAVDGCLDISPQEAALIGWIITDGSVESTVVAGKRHRFVWGEDSFDTIGKVRIWQSKPDGLRAVRAVLDGFPHTERERKTPDGQLQRWVFQVDPLFVRDVVMRAQVCGRSLDSFVIGLTLDARKAFLRACFDAEGWRPTKGSTLLISQNAGPKLNAMILCAYLCGKRPCVSAGTVHQRSGHTNKTLSLCSPIIVPKRLHQKAGRTEKVWCPATELGTWTMRFAGHIVLTGNSETVEQGVSGFRCRTMAEFDAAVEAAPGLSREKIRERAIRLYSTEAVAAQYDRYFKRLADLYEDGFYQSRQVADLPGKREAQSELPS